MKFCINVMVSVLLFAFVSLATAQQEEPPEGGKPKPFNLPEKTVFSLQNGLDATMVPYGKLPKVTVEVVIRAGNLNESENQVWLADLTGEYLKEGTESLTSEALAKKMAGMGGELNVAVGMDQTTISADVLAEYGPQLVGLLADVVQSPSFPEAELERLKNDRIRQLNIAKSQPQSLAREKFRALLYPDHPYGRIFPTEAMINGYTIEDVRNFYEQNFGAQRTQVYVAGVFDSDMMEAAIRGAFANWQKGPITLLNIPNPVTERAVHIIDRPDAPQSTIYLGLPVIDPSHEDYLALQVTNALLGGSFASRITSNIREDKGYTYSPRSRVSARYRDAHWVQMADVTTDVTGAALKEIFYEIDRLQEEPPSEQELKGIQNYVAGTFVLQNSSRGGIINQLQFLNLHELDDRYLNQYVQNVHALTPGKVREMARTYLRDKNMTIVIVGDTDKIKEQVKPYGKVVL